MSVGLTERRMLRTREQVLEVASAMFGERGFDATTVEDIAAAAGISQRTVFRYFSTKEDVVLAISRTGWGLFLDALSARPLGESRLAAVRGAVTEAFAPTWQDGPRVRAFLLLVRETPSVRARWVEQASAAQADLAEVLAGRDAAPVGLRHRITAGAVTVAITTALQEWVSSSSARSPATIVDRALRQLAEPLL